MKNIVATLLISFLIFSCSKKELTPSLDETFKLSFEQSAQIESENVTIKFVDVTDSRCPDGAQCVWAGEGVVSLNVNNSEFDISTLSPTDTLGYTFSIISLNPYPILDAELKNKDYQVELMVSK